MTGPLAFHLLGDQIALALSLLRSKCTSNRLKSEVPTPGTRDACPTVNGRNLLRFSRASLDRPRTSP